MFPSGVFISPFHLPFRSVALAAVKPANITIALKAITKVLIFGKLLSAGRSTHPGFPVRPAVIEYIVSAGATGWVIYAGARDIRVDGREAPIRVAAGCPLARERMPATESGNAPSQPCPRVTLLDGRQIG